ncbi:hypothetical protein WR25_17218 [Diploscapter pachys]|uniref:VOC domain-containing protein n=1 Tax=Diploscapter pachys TaxID=2018661 RepID=A0A2A2JVJ4_9BILA|nr:hypothetical protein WR25_17218 [Diploscapter pachys]
MTSISRALHYVFKIGDRKASYEFYTKILYMKAILIDSDQIYDELDKAGNARKTDCGRLAITDPDGHCFKIGRGSAQHKISCVAVNVADLSKSIDYWHNLLDMPIAEKTDKHVILSYGAEQCKWKLCQLGGDKKIDRGTAFGRIAFAYPGEKLLELQNKVKAAGGKIINELVTLETPGKADVQVVILADPNDHEICFVGEAGFKDLSRVDSQADAAMQKAIADDDSNEWFSQFKNGKKAAE